MQKFVKFNRNCKIFAQNFYFVLGAREFGGSGGDRFHQDGCAGAAQALYRLIRIERF